jgi:hypothetical protein
MTQINLPPHTVEAKRFLKLLDPAGNGFTFQTFHDKRPGTKPELARVVESPAQPELLQLHAHGAGIYITVNETDSKGRKLENIKRIRAVWQEDDGGFDSEFPLAPSMVVETSPGRRHRYWLVSDDWPADEKGRADFAAVMERMVESYGSDKNAKDITRVLRLPGFLHRKNGSPHLVHIIEASERRYSRADIIAAFPPVERQKKQESQREWKPRGDDDQRIRDALFCISADDRDVWLQIGMALKDRFGDSGRSLWDEWSRRSDKNNERDQDKTWKSLKRSGITIATLFHHAKQAGWNEERPRGNGANGAQASEQQPNAPQSKETLHNWDDPDISLLDDRRGDLPEFPVDVFTPAWQDWLLRASHGAGVRPDHVALPLLGVASSLIGTARRVRASRSWSEPMTLWACVVAASGDRKTPGLNVTVRALDLIEKNNSADVSAKRLTHETKVQKAKEVQKRWKEDREAALKFDPPKEPPPMPADAIDPGNFIEPRLYATDPTIERLAALLLARPRGMILIRDELAGLFANMGRYSGGSDRPFWLEAWNGGRHVVERVSGSISVDHLMIGVVGSFQPDKLARAFAGDEDGMYGRFLYGWPLAPDYRPLTNDAAEVEPELQSALTALIRLPSEDVEGVFSPQAVWLSDDALARFEEFRKLVDAKKRGLDGHERQWFVKGETMVLRLAGTLAFMAWAIELGQPSSTGLDGITGSLEPRTVGEQYISAAIRLWGEYLWPHARASLRQIGLSDRHKHARRVLQWLKANAGVAEISIKNIRRDALAQSLDAKETEEVLNGLTKAGWLRRKPAEPASGPGRPAHRWLVNPALY